MSRGGRYQDERQGGQGYLYGWSANILPFIASVTIAEKLQMDIARQVVLD